MSTLRLHQHPLSGHSHRVALFLSILGLPYQRIEVDVRAGAHKQPPFLALNPLGQVPVLEDGALVIPDSNAILVYLAGRHDPEGRWYPRDPLGAGQVQRWLSIAAGQLAAGPARARLIKIFGLPQDPAPCIAIAEQLFGFLERHVGAQPFLVGDRATIADLALYAYCARAPEGGVSLEPYPQLRAWLARIEALPGFVPMPRLPA